MPAFFAPICACQMKKCQLLHFICALFQLMIDYLWKNVYFWHRFMTIYRLTASYMNV